tara:strand:- start:2814 stop:4880 length:2067 start_codon:yes stop_codon:yes gene_type:complete
MTIAREFVAKLAVAFVAVAMVLSAFAPAAQAQTTEELQAMINDLLAQVAALQAGAGQDAGVSSDVCPYTWTRDLSTGSTGADVMKLQQFLNADPDTRVAVSGVGSAGMETEYYGPATAAAVSKMQVKYRADILSPANLVNPTGFFGPSSRTKANSLCVAAPVMDDDMGDDDMMDDDEDEDDSDNTLSGEASLNSVSVNSEESEVEEGEEDVAVMELGVEFENGDAEIARLDVELTADGGNAEDEPWEVFETVSLWIDGDMIAEADADDEDEYLDEDDGSIRFSGLDIFAEEDEEVEIIVAVSMQNNLESMPETWNVTVESMRFFDADGVAETVTDGDTDADELGDLVEFDVEAEGSNEDLDVSLSSNNPDSTDIVVDTDSDTNDVTILVADLEAEDNDLEVDTFIVRVNTTGASTTDVVDDIRVVIGGQSFDAENVSNSNKGTISGSDSRYVDNDVTDDAVWYVFDIDGDVTLEEDEEVDLEVVVDLKDTNDGARYSNGTQIEATITSVELAAWDVEGADDVTPSGSAAGDTHTLVAEGILVPVDGVETTTDTSGDNDTLGEFEIEFEVTAVEGDFYIRELATEGTSATTGVEFTVDGTSATTSGTLSSTADEDTAGVFTVREGETETFTLRVTVNPDASGDFRVNLTGVNYAENSNGFYVTAGTDGDLYVPTPAQDFRTSYETIQGS